MPSTKPLPEEEWPEVCGSFDVGNPALAKEIARRWNSYPALVEALQFVLYKNHQGYISFCGMPYKQKLQEVLAEAMKK